MADTRKLQIEIEIDDAGAISKLRNLENAGDRAATKHIKQGGAIKGVSMAYTELSSKVNLLRDVWQTASSIIDAPIAAAKEETARNVELIATLTQRAMATKENIKALQDQQAQLSMSLGVDDEKITKIQTIGLQMGQLAVEQVPAYTKAVLAYSEQTGRGFEMSAKTIAAYMVGATDKIRGLVLETDGAVSAQKKLSKATDQVADAQLNVSEKTAVLNGLMSDYSTAKGPAAEKIGKAIARAQEAVNKAQEKLVEKQGKMNGLQETANQLNNRGVELIDKLGAGWAAMEAKGKTFEGAQNKLNIAWENMLSAFGRMLTDSPAVSQALEKVALWIQDMANKLNENPDMINNIVRGFQDFVAQSPGMIDSLRQIGDALTVLAKPLGWVMDGLNGVRSWGESPDETYARQNPNVTGPLTEGVDGWHQNESGGWGRTSSAARSASTTRGTSGITINNVDELARAIAGYSNLTLAEARVG